MVVLATILFNSRLRDIVVWIYVLITIFCISDCRFQWFLYLYLFTETKES